MSLNKSVSKLLILCLLIGISSVDAQSYLVESAIKPTPSIKSSASFYVVSSIEPVENHGSSASYIVSGDITYGEASTPTPTTPTTTTPPSSGGSSGGGRGKYDASNWLLARVYNELLAAAGGEIDDEEFGYASAPKDREPLPPFPVDEFEETEESIPVVEPPTKKELQANIFEPQVVGKLKQEEVLPPSETSVFGTQSFEEMKESIQEGKILELPGSLFVTIDLAQDERMFPLYPSSQQRVVFIEGRDSCSTFVVAGDCFRYVLCWFWILILLIFVNLCLLFWQLLIVNRLIHEDENKENKFKKFFKDLYKKFISLFK